MPLACADLKITIVYDNNSYDSRLSTAWGFAAVIEYGTQTVLFDTGGRGQMRLRNMEILGIDPHQIQTVVLSHYHGDHTGGLDELLAKGAHPTVYMLSCFAPDFKDHARHMANVVEVTPGQYIADGVYTTGEMDGASIHEQALVLKTDRGLVVVTGCAHPGIVKMVERAKTLFGEPIHLVLGGFHLRGQPDKELKSILADFRRLGVEKVAPVHCSGDRAVEMFRREYDESFLKAGVGRVITFEP
jgi:7,8-dihydropterin-6-yl-methyl-4-(beta-D-ribofuranosyl)aminobenzene 5'-phosphate synthase